MQTNANAMPANGTKGTLSSLRHSRPSFSRLWISEVFSCLHTRYIHHTLPQNTVHKFADTVTPSAFFFFLSFHFSTAERPRTCESADSEEDDSALTTTTINSTLAALLLLLLPLRLPWPGHSKCQTINSKFNAKYTLHTHTSRSKIVYSTLIRSEQTSGAVANMKPNQMEWMQQKSKRNF